MQQLNQLKSIADESITLFAYFFEVRIYIVNIEKKEAINFKVTAGIKRKNVLSAI